MFSEETLLRNLAALDEAQGQRPAFGALNPDTTRVVENPAEHGSALRIEIRCGEDWLPLCGSDPVAQARAQIDTAPDAEHIFVIGAGLGHALDALESAGRTAKVLVLEPDPGVAVLFLARRDWQPWLSSGRLRLLTGPHYLGASTMARTVNGARSTAILANPVLAAHHPALVETATKVAQRIQQEAAANADARRQHAGRYLLQTLGNLPVIERESDIAGLYGAFPGRPAVMVAAGPSLDAALPVLAAYQDQVVIIACDTTLRPLLAAGIRPHVMVGVDPGEINARHLSGVPDLAGIWMAAEGSLHPSAFTGFAGRAFIFKVSDHEPWPWLREAGLDRGTLRAWGSVATSAFDLALRMGCDPIIFAGADMAYTNDRPYCDNTVFHEEWRTYLQQAWGTIREDHMHMYEQNMMAGRPLITVTDVNGLPVRTASQLLAFRDWIVEQTTVTRDRTFINATGGGILQGPRIAQMKLEVALGRHAGPPLDVRGTLAGVHRRWCKSYEKPGTPSDEVIDRWIEFTAGTVDKDTITAKVRSVTTKATKTTK